MLALFLERHLLLVLVCSAAAVATAVEGWKFLFPVLNRWVHMKAKGFFKTKERKKLTGSTCLLLATTLVFLLFQKEVAILALLFLAAGDPAAATVGERFGKRKFYDKSLEGCLAFIVVCTGVAAIAVGFGLGLSIPVVAVGLACATVAELLPVRFDDNFTIPLISGAGMTIAIAIESRCFL